jgi:hypothetical protein
MITDPTAAHKYIADSLADVVGNDAASREFRHHVEDRQDRSLYLAGRVLIPTMTDAIPLRTIYRDLRISASDNPDDAVSITTLISADQNSAVIIAPPGRGKTVSLRYLFTHGLNLRVGLPLLYTLHDDGALGELDYFIEGLSSGRRVGPGFRRRRVLLLLDGYDEIPKADRVTLSRMLIKFEALNAGSFVLSCRTYYEIIDMPVRRRYLLPFTREDSEAFLQVFLAHQKSSHSAAVVLREMSGRGFEDFIENPLMLALVSVLQSRRHVSVPRNALQLLEEVVLFLTYKREAELSHPRECIEGLYPDDLLKCLQKIAYSFEAIEELAIRAEHCIEEYLKLRQVGGIKPIDVMMELARWYGLVVPVGARSWRFVHRSIHDFLAAKYILAHNLLNQDTARRNWRRTSYAACYLDDATTYIHQSIRGPLGQGGDLDMFVECCANDGSFNPFSVVADLVWFYDGFHGMCAITRDEASRTVQVELEQDYLIVVKTPMLHAMVEVCAKKGAFKSGGAVVLGLALSELHRRSEPITHIDTWSSWCRGLTWRVKRAGLTDWIEVLT